MIDLSPLVDELSKKHGKRLKLANFLKDIKDKVSTTKNIQEPFLTKEVKNKKLEKVAAVDGGLVSRSLYGLDFCLIRAAGVTFDYSKKKANVEYFPQEFPTPQLKVNTSGEGFEIYSGIERMKSEVDLSAEIIDRFSPSVHLLHGSLVPNSSYKSKRFSKEYQELLDSLMRLYKASVKNKCMLVGVVEDSQGTRISEIVSKDILSGIDDPKVSELIKVLKETRDSGLLYHVLERGERSFAFRYSKAPKEHLILKDFGDYGMNLRVFYLKSAKLDKPLRVEFLGPLEFADIISSSILPLCSSDVYGMPVPIIEADQRAKLLEKDADLVYQDLLDEFPEVKLRRNYRPF